MGRAAWTPVVTAAALAAALVTQASTRAAPVTRTPSHTSSAWAAVLTPAAFTGASATTPLAGLVFAVDPGHNGGNARAPGVIDALVNAVTERKACDTTGTSTNAGYTEAAFTFDVALRLRAVLRSRGATVVLTRSSNSGVGPCITRRAQIGNAAHATAAISIHADGAASAAYGFHIIEPAPVGPNDRIVRASAVLGLAVRDAVHTDTGEPYANYLGHAGLIVRSDLGGLNLSTVPKVFIEAGNMRNASDAARLTSPAFRQRLALALADGLAAYARRSVTRGR